ncbi:hypothetical protein KFL_000160340 [Klebsormidium nitens]|uniref:SnoaL-like domain-containing protein n=1 Tax=Klebsormidium nitens TaxID=105231 RepID=A0A1Y1HNS2_KLENI|nr:hypothetical protein KFL_000160340 [Klebsormidium nitens]|eukprot:GAQ78631.1 hypothetical protein KFL_000160340 [Klebsormidium nitens]
MTELFSYLLDKDIPKFQAGFTDDAIHKYAGGPGLPYTGPFKGQDSFVRAQEIYLSVFNATRRSVDLAVSPSTGKVIAQIDAGIIGIETGVEFDEDCFLYITLNDDLLVTRIIENCNSLAEFVALQSKPCAKMIEECAKQHDKKGEKVE